MYITDKFLKFSVNELLKFCHISKINTCIVLHMWQLKHCFDLSYLYIHTHKHTQRHTCPYKLKLTQIKILQFVGKIAK